MKMTAQESRWRYEARNAIWQLNMKRQSKGRSRWTYAQFADWFKAHFEAGVHMGINAEDELLNECKLGMYVPSWSLIAVLR